MRGYLTIHVGGYRLKSSYTIHVFSNGTESYSIPDRRLPTEVHSPDTLAWAEHGWAVGDNTRDRFCKWAAHDKVRRFLDYDEAVAFIHRLRQKRKARQEVYTLVYFPRTESGSVERFPVSSLDEIVAFDEKTDAEYAVRQKRQQEVFPELDRLREHFGAAAGSRLSLLLAQLRSDGAAKIPALTQEHELIRDVSEYGAFFQRASSPEQGGLIHTE